MAKLSLCMIVKDEAERLPVSLASARGVVDEVVVVDTGSADGTADVARRAGARVESFAWCDDFARARNASLAAATGDWALVLDADEVLAEPRRARARLDAFARDHDGTLGRLRIENHAAGRVESTVSIARFLPLGRGILYHGRVHESPTREGAISLAAADTGVTALHSGYAAEVIDERSKLERNLRLGRLALADDPTDAYSAWQLGRTLALAGRHAEALTSFQLALDQAPPGAAFRISLIEGAAGSLRELGRSDEALALLERQLPGRPPRADTLFLEALCRMDVGQVAAAEAGFRRCLELGPSPSGVVESAPSAATWAPAHNLGVLCECLDRPAEARAWYERALELWPDHGPSRAGLDRLAALA